MVYAQFLSTIKSKKKVTKNTPHRDHQAMVAQLDPIAHQILSLATSDNNFIRSAAEECFDAITTELSDVLRYCLTKFSHIFFFPQQF